MFPGFRLALMRDHFSAVKSTAGKQRELDRARDARGDSSLGFAERNEGALADGETGVEARKFPAAVLSLLNRFTIGRPVHK